MAGSIRGSTSSMRHQLRISSDAVSPWRLALGAVRQHGTGMGSLIVLACCCSS